MTWFNISDGAAFHRKIVDAGNEAFGAWARAGAWSSAPENLTDGLISAGIAATIAPARVWRRLLSAGLVEPRPGGAYQIHDFLAYNKSAVQVRAEREGWKDRQRRAREKQGESPPLSRRDTPRDYLPESRACHTAPDPDPIPDPGDPEHTHTAGARVFHPDAPEPGEDPDVEALGQAIALHPTLAGIAARAPAGAMAAIRSLAEQTAGRMHSSAHRREDVLRAIGEAGADLAAEPGVSWVAAAKRVRSYADRARPIDDRSRAPPRAGGRRHAPQAAGDEVDRAWAEEG